MRASVKISLKVLAATVAGLVGAVLSRWHGGGFIGGSPKILKAFLWAAPFACSAYFAHFVYFAHFASWQGITATLGALALCMLGKNTGHGGGMDLAHSPKEPDGDPKREPEKLEYLILWLHGKMPQYWYDALLLALVGFAAVSGAAIAVGLLYPVAGIIIAVGGALKALAYMIGWRIYPQGTGDGPRNLDEATAVGEFFTGFFAYLGLAISIMLI